MKLGEFIFRVFIGTMVVLVVVIAFGLLVEFVQ